MDDVGPFSADLGEDERRRQLRCLAGICATLVGTNHAVVTALHQAELGGGELDEARALFEQLPALSKRRLLSVFSAVTYWKR